MKKQTKVNKNYGKENIEQYANPDDWEIWDTPVEFETIYQMFPEFTCLCPRSGYPDFAKVHIVIVPKKKVVELKVLKMWLNSFRDRRISHENATFEIFDTLCKKLDLAYCFVLMEYTPRGNLTTFPMLEMAHKMYEQENSLVHFAWKNATQIKEIVINSVVHKQLK